MVRLDFARSKKLKESDIGKLWNYITTARNADRDYFATLKELRFLHKTGTQGELRDLDKSAQTVANLAHAHVAALRPTLFFREPTVETHPTEEKHEGKAETWKNLINNTNKRTGFKKEVKKCVTDSIVYPEAWIKSFISKVDDPEADDTDKPSGVTGATTETGYGGPVAWLSKDAPAHSRVAPSQVVVDYMSPDRSTEHARFVDIMYVRDLKELQADKRYKGIASQLRRNKAFLKPGKSGSHSPKTDPFALAGEDFWEANRMMSDNDHVVILHEIWVHQLVDLRLYKQLVVLVEGADGLMINEPIRFDIWESDDVLGEFGDFYPITRIALNEVPDFKPNSELGVWSSMHAAVNWILSRIVSFVDSEKQLWYIDEDKIADRDTALKAIKSKSSREAIFGKGPKGIEPVSNFFAGRDNYNLLNMLNEMIRRVGGVTENRAGQGGESRTATEAANVESGVRVKIDEKRAIIADWLKEVIEKEIKLIRHIVKKADNTRFVFRIAGDTGDVRWLDFDSTEINWQPDIDIQVFSFIKPTRQEEVQAASMALETGMRLKVFHSELRTDILYRKLLESLEITEIGKIVDNESEHAMIQAVEIAMIMAGSADAPPVTPDQNHVVHSRVIQQFLNNPDAVEIRDTNPQGWEALIQHKEQHDQMIEQVQGAVQQATPSGQNPFDDLNAGPESGQPANVNREIAGRDREVADSVGGGGGIRG